MQPKHDFFIRNIHSHLHPPRRPSVRLSSSPRHPSNLASQMKTPRTSSSSRLMSDIHAAEDLLVPDFHHTRRRKRRRRRRQRKAPLPYLNPRPRFLLLPNTNQPLPPLLRLSATTTTTSTITTTIPDGAPFRRRTRMDIGSHDVRTHIPQRSLIACGKLTFPIRYHK